MADAPAPTPKPAVESPAAQSQLAQIGMVLGIGVAIANAAFFFLSMAYAKHRPVEDLTQVRIDFATFTVAVAGMAFVGAVWPRWVGHGLAAALGLVELAAGVGALNGGRPAVLGIALLVIGALGVTLAWQSYVRSRAAWSFLIAICAVLALTLLFGAPKVRAQLGIGLWIALIYPGMCVVATATLATLRADYRR